MNNKIRIIFSKKVARQVEDLTSTIKSFEINPPLWCSLFLQIVIMQKCWKFEPRQRCTFDDIVSILKDRMQHQECTPQNLLSEPSELILDTSDIEGETEPMISFHKLQGADQSSHKGVGQKCQCLRFF